MGYQNTSSRRPIAAMFSSPGPAYALPGLVGDRCHDPRSVHHKSPAYSFGVRHGSFRESCGPGPNYYPDPKVYRDGRDGVPHYSLFSRPKGPTVFSTPAPGHYCPEKSTGVVKTCNPAYSFGSRHRHKRTDSTPAPNSYILPGMIGPTVQSGKPQAPCYSFRPALKFRFLPKHGADVYSPTDPSVYKTRAPLYSLTSRHEMPGDRSQRPGPMTYKPNTDCVKRCNPAFSFGVRHSDYMTPIIVDVPSIECCYCY